MNPSDVIGAQLVLFMHCRTCREERRKEQLVVGLTHGGLRVWCEACNQEVQTFTPGELKDVLERFAGGECLCEACIARKARS